MSKTLFESIGGAEVVEKVVDRFYDRVVGDEHLKKFFAHSSVDRIKSMQRQLFSVALGGPLDYDGKPLGEVHKGRGITREDIGIFIDHLFETLKDLEIESDNANQFVARIATYADEVLGETTVDG